MNLTLFTAANRLRGAQNGLAVPPKLHVASLGSCQGGPCPVRDHFPLMLGNRGQDIYCQPVGHGHVDRDDSTPLSMRPETKWTFRARRSSLAMRRVAFCFRQASRAARSCGRACQPGRQRQQRPFLGDRPGDRDQLLMPYKQLPGRSRLEWFGDIRGCYNGHSAASS
jgi:hypothetical protein